MVIHILASRSTRAWFSNGDRRSQRTRTARGTISRNISSKMFYKWLWNDIRMISEWFCNDLTMINKWFDNDLYIPSPISSKPGSACRFSHCFYDAIYQSSRNYARILHACWCPGSKHSCTFYVDTSKPTAGYDAQWNNFSQSIPEVCVVRVISNPFWIMIVAVETVPHQVLSSLCRTVPK